MRLAKSIRPDRSRYGARALEVAHISHGKYGEQNDNDRIQRADGHLVRVVDGPEAMNAEHIRRNSNGTHEEPDG